MKEIIIDFNGEIIVIRGVSNKNEVYEYMRDHLSSDELEDWDFEYGDYEVYNDLEGERIDGYLSISEYLDEVKDRI